MRSKKPRRYKRRTRTNDGFDLGSAEFDCRSCGHNFAVPWSVIFDLQEMTHGFVGFWTAATALCAPSVAWMSMLKRCLLPGNLTKWREPPTPIARVSPTAREPDEMEELG